MQPLSRARRLALRSGATPSGLSVWALRPSDADHFEGLLSESERARAARFRFDVDRQRHIVGVGASRSALGEALARDPRTLRFALGEHGKPQLEGPRPLEGPCTPEGRCTLEANVAHSGAWVLVALSERGAVGVDVEAHRELDVEELAREVYTPAEQRELAALRAEPERARVAFFRTWARKEAALKAWGTGLSLAARTVEVGLDEAPSRLVRGAAHGHSDVIVEDLVLDDEHAAAVASAQR